ncbi:AAA family ATPase [Kribbella sp. NPDC049584]|uniref:AAA family ATPase n=1 Tax=Kribbella sp. NPDC049584 TaxID=3154833 RepID=UPI0034179EA1
MTGDGAATSDSKDTVRQDGAATSDQTTAAAESTEPAAGTSDDAKSAEAADSAAESPTTDSEQPGTTPDAPSEDSDPSPTAEATPADDTSTPTDSSAPNDTQATGHVGVQASDGTTESAEAPAQAADDAAQQSGDDTAQNDAGTPQTGEGTGQAGESAGQADEGAAQGGEGTERADEGSAEAGDDRAVQGAEGAASPNAEGGAVPDGGQEVRPPVGVVYEPDESPDGFPLEYGNIIIGLPKQPENTTQDAAGAHPDPDSGDQTGSIEQQLDLSDDARATGGAVDETARGAAEHDADAAANESAETAHEPTDDAEDETDEAADATASHATDDAAADSADEASAAEGADEQASAETADAAADETAGESADGSADIRQESASDASGEANGAEGEPANAVTGEGADGSSDTTGESTDDAFGEADGAEGRRATAAATGEGVDGSSDARQESADGASGEADDAEGKSANAATGESDGGSVDGAADDAAGEAASSSAEDADQSASDGADESGDGAGESVDEVAGGPVAGAAAGGAGGSADEGADESAGGAGGDSAVVAEGADATNGGGDEAADGGADGAAGGGTDGAADSGAEGAAGGGADGAAGGGAEGAAGGGADGAAGGGADGAAGGGADGAAGGGAEGAADGDADSTANGDADSAAEGGDGSAEGDGDVEGEEELTAAQLAERLAAEQAAMALITALMKLRGVLAGSQLPLEVVGADEARQQQKAMLDQLDDYLLPRLVQLEAPVLAVVGGSTGAGKSTLVNSVIGKVVSEPGVLRPTTRSPVLIHHPADADWFVGDRVLPGMARTSADEPGGMEDAGQLRLVAAGTVPRGLAILDAPDIDSVVEANRDLATQLLGAADLWLFVTTAARYSDAVPWEFLQSASDRSTAVAVVLDRAPSETIDDITGHLAQMLLERGLGDSPLFSIQETVVDGNGMLPQTSVASIKDWLVDLAADAEARAGVVRRTLQGAVSAMVKKTPPFAEAVKAQADTAIELRSSVESAYDQAVKDIAKACQDGTLLRGEVLARWQEFVGTGELLKGLQSNAGRLRDRLKTSLGNKPAETRDVSDAIQSGLESLLREHATAAAERAEKAWQATAPGRQLLAAGDAQLAEEDSENSLGALSPAFPDAAARAVREWQAFVLDVIRKEGGAKKSTARILEYGVNGLGLSLMVVVFARETGIPKGAEASAGAGSAVVGQRLLEAVFGDKAVQGMVDKAREDLDGKVHALMDAEFARYLAVLDQHPVDAETARQLTEAARAVEDCT